MFVFVVGVVSMTSASWVGPAWGYGQEDDALFEKRINQRMKGERIVER